MLCQREIAAIALNLVASEHWREGPEESTASACRVTVGDFVHGDVQLKTVVDHLLPSTVNEEHLSILRVQVH